MGLIGRLRFGKLLRIPRLPGDSNGHLPQWSGPRWACVSDRTQSRGRA